MHCVYLGLWWDDPRGPTVPENGYRIMCCKGSEDAWRDHDEEREKIR